MSAILNLSHKSSKDLNEIVDANLNGISLIDTSNLLSMKFVLTTQNFNYNFANSLFHSSESFFFETFLKRNESHQPKIQSINKYWWLQASNRKVFKLVGELDNEFRDLDLHNNEVLHFWDAVNVLNLYGVNYTVEAKTYFDDEGKIILGFEIIVLEDVYALIYLLIYHNLHLYYSVWIQFLNLPPPFHILCLIPSNNFINGEEYENSKKICCSKKEKI